jgi:30S ribosomal protein S31
MGKGDRKTRRGKIYRSSYGNVRTHSAQAVSGENSAAAVKSTGAKKTASKKKTA